MKRRAARLFLIAIAMASAGGGIAMAVQPSEEVVELLTATTSSPSKTRIVIVMGETAADELIAIAEDTSADSDPGLQISAYAALRHFEQSPESETVRLALKAAVVQRQGESTGTPLLVLRAAMLSLAEVGRATSVSDLLPLLSHPSRDIRAACAQALGITGSDAAITPLRDRLLDETVPQVKLAIDDALFELDSD